MQADLAVVRSIGHASNKMIRAAGSRVLKKCVEQSRPNTGGVAQDIGV